MTLGIFDNKTTQLKKKLQKLSTYMEKMKIGAPDKDKLESLIEALALRSRINDGVDLIEILEEHDYQLLCQEAPFRIQRYTSYGTNQLGKEINLTDALGEMSLDLPLHIKLSNKLYRHNRQFNKTK